MSLYLSEYYGYTRRGSKAHRLYQVEPFPQLLTHCTSTPVVVTYHDESMPDPTVDDVDNPWCLHCYPHSGTTLPMPLL